MTAGEPVGDHEFAALMAPLGPFAPSPRLAIGVSGGPDSLATFLLAHRWAVARGGSALALVADHGLRPDSAGEALAVADRLRARGYEVRILSLGLPPGPALHERARRARLSALEAAAAEAGAPWLLLGHHRRDQAETLLFRLLRGSGEAGLAAMAPARAMPGAMVLRPLLDMPVARLEATVAAAALEPVRDPSNADPRFARVRLRAALGDPSGDAAGTRALALAADAFARRRAAGAAAVAGRLALAAAFRPEGWAWLDAVALGHDAVARQALSRLLQAVSGRPHPPPREGVERMLAEGGGTLGGVLWRGRLLCREPAACAPPVAARRGATWDGRWHLDRDVPAATLGAPGADLARLGPIARRGMPAAVLRGCPVLRHGDGRVELLPAGASFRPAGGPPA
jgi:tRNA(Ile)-lysidine synthase